MKIQNLDIFSTFYAKSSPGYTILYVSISTASITTKFAIVIALLEETVIKVYQIYTLGSSRDGGIEPAKHIFGHRFIAKETPIDKDRLPLATLRLVARHGIGELDLKGVEVGILAYGLVSLGLSLDVGIVFFHFVEEGAALLTRKRG